MANQVKMELKLESGVAVEKFTSADDIVIVGDDGRSLYNICMKEDGTLEISSGSSSARFDGGPILDAGLVIEPKTSNVINISRKVYK